MPKSAMSRAVKILSLIYHIWYRLFVVIMISSIRQRMLFAELNSRLIAFQLLTVGLTPMMRALQIQLVVIRIVLIEKLRDTLRFVILLSLITH